MTCYFSSTAVSESDTCVLFPRLNLSHKLKDKGTYSPHPNRGELNLWK
ncbi:MAG: hypothetical protein L7U54_01800 [Flavobacteriaceae bacterium]|nr:hypothetical protein [Flavobacteriaceae bacterium]